MKIRNGFVSNSSNSSFVVAVPKGIPTWESYADLIRKLFQDEVPKVRNTLVNDICRGMQFRDIADFFHCYETGGGYCPTLIEDPKCPFKEVAPFDDDTLEKFTLEYDERLYDYHLSNMQFIIERIFEFYKRNKGKTFVLIGAYRYGGMAGTPVEQWIADHHEEVFKNVDYLKV